MENSENIQDKINSIRTLILDPTNDSRAESFLNQLYEEYNPIEKIEKGTAQEKALAWQIIDLRSMLVFKNKYSPDL